MLIEFKMKFQKYFNSSVPILMIILFISISSCSKKLIPETTAPPAKVLNDKDFQNYTYLFSEAIKQKLLGNIQKSVSYYDQCLKINPASDAAMFELSNLYSLAGEYKIGLKYAVMATNTDPENLWYQLHLANLYRAVNMNDSSIVIYEDILSKHPEKTDLYFNLGNIYKENGYNKKALNVFDELEAQYGFQPNISVLKSEIFEADGKFDEAEDEYRRLVTAFPEEPRYYILLAELYYKQGKNEEALKEYEEVNNLDKENDLVLLSKIGFYRNIGDYDQVFGLMDSIISRNTINVDTKIQLMFSFLTNPEEISKNTDELLIRLETLRKLNPDEIRINALIADYYVKIENYQKASEELKNYLKKDKTNYVIWEQLLFVENILRNSQDLYDISKEALTLFRTAPILYFFNGVACTELNKYEEAKSVLLKGLEFARDNKALLIQYYSMLGETYRNLDENELSDKAFDDALNLDPENLPVLNNYSYYLSLRDSDLKKALKMSSVTVKAEPLNATYLDTYGWILHKLGKNQEASKYLKKAIENDEAPSGEILQHYGDVLILLGRSEEALKYYREALKYLGDTKELEKKIKRSEKQ